MAAKVLSKLDTADVAEGFLDAGEDIQKASEEAGGKFGKGDIGGGLLSIGEGVLKSGGSLLAGASGLTQRRREEARLAKASENERLLASQRLANEEKALAIRQSEIEKQAEYNNAKLALDERLANITNQKDLVISGQQYDLSGRKIDVDREQFDKRLMQESKVVDLTFLGAGSDRELKRELALRELEDRDKERSAQRDFIKEQNRLKFLEQQQISSEEDIRRNAAVREQQLAFARSKAEQDVKNILAIRLTKDKQPMGKSQQITAVRVVPDQVKKFESKFRRYRR
jgi:hypothetical protein